MQASFRVREMDSALAHSLPPGARAYARVCVCVCVCVYVCVCERERALCGIPTSPDMSE